MKIWDIRLNRKVILAMAIFTYSTLFFISVFIIIDHRDATVNGIMGGARAIANTLAQQLQRNTMPSRLFPIKNDVTTYNFAIYDRRGKLLIATFPQLFKEFHTKYSIDEIYDGATVYLRNKPGKVIIKDAGTYRIEGIVDLEKIDRQLFYYGIRLTAIMILLGLLIIVGITFILNEVVSKPIATLKGELVSIIKGEKSNIVEIEKDDEISDLFRIINRLITLWRDLLRHTTEEIHRVEHELRHLSEKIKKVETREFTPSEFFREFEKTVFQLNITRDFYKELQKLPLKNYLNNIIMPTFSSFTNKWERMSKHISEEITYSSQLEKEREKWNENLMIIGKNMERLYYEIEKVDELIEKLKYMGDNTKQLVEEIKEREEIIETSINDSYSVISRITEIMNSMEQNRAIIRKTLGYLEIKIEDIEEFTDQTNLLSLNASIISAQITGTEGKSFGIIAEEVKELSETVFDALQEMENKIMESREYSDSNSNLVREMLKEIGTLREFITMINNSVAKNDDTFRKINERLRSSDGLIDQITNELSKIEELISTTSSGEKFEWLEDMNRWITRIEKFITITYNNQLEIQPDVSKLKEGFVTFKEEWMRYEMKLGDILKSLSEVTEENKSLFEHKEVVEHYMNELEAISVEIQKRINKINNIITLVGNDLEKNLNVKNTKKGSEE